jgi:hypothetical protein
MSSWNIEFFVTGKQGFPRSKQFRFGTSKRNFEANKRKMVLRRCRSIVFVLTVISVILRGSSRNVLPDLRDVEAVTLSRKIALGIQLERKLGANQPSAQEALQCPVPREVFYM